MAQRGSEMIFQFLSPSLCQRCKALTVKFDGPGNFKLPFGYQQNDVYGPFSELESLANSGCEFCGFLRSCLLSKIHNRPFKPETQPSGRDVVVEIEDLYLFQYGREDLSQKLVHGFLDVDVNRGSIVEEFFRIEFQTHGREFKCLHERPLSICQVSDVDFITALRELPSRNPLSDQNVETIRLWLQECGETHKKCNSNTSFSPTRLIAVNSSGEPLQIVHSEGRLLDYAALSYCWGKQGKDALYVTKLTNLINRQAGFAQLELPQTLQDAVDVVRKLGIQYIWIDALCIIQDDIGDWEKEAKSMGDIFENSRFTIAATAAGCSSDGFLTRPSCCNLKIPFAVKKQNKTIQSGIFYLGYPDLSNTSALISNSTWNRRGWIFQEQILSKKLLYFTDDILYFKCLSAQKVEDDAYRFPNTLWIPWLRDDKIQKSWSFFSSTRKDFYLGWYSIVEEYSKRELSFSDDRLPAISGLAQKMALTINDKYLAGLWRGDLYRGISWQPNTRCSLRRPRKPRTPSWSWAALEGEVKWRAGPLRKGYSIEILAAEVTFSGLNDMGQVTGGQLVLSGKLLPVGKILHNPRELLSGWYIGLHGEEAEHDLGSHFSLEGNIQALIIASNEGLLLEPTGHLGEQNEEFRRIGLFRCKSSVFRRVKPRVITII